MTTQTKQAWTPGPWRVKHSSGHGEKYGWEVVTEKLYPYHGNKKLMVAESITGWGCVTATEANARLISKAPAMAELLRRWEKSERTETNDVNLLDDTERLLADLEAK